LGQAVLAQELLAVFVRRAHSLAQSSTHCAEYNFTRMAMKVVKQVSFVAACASTALVMQGRNVYFVNSGSVDYELSSYSLSSRRRTTWGGVYNKFDHLNIQASSPISMHSAQS